MPEPKETTKNAEETDSVMKKADQIVLWVVVIPICWAIAFWIVSWAFHIWPHWWK
jgi:ABC-type oligopeptide transport system substrate-binding subunit